MLTLKTCFDAINHKLAIGSDQPLDRLNIVNQAGAILYAQPWRWLEAELWALDLVQGSDRVALPPELGELEDVWPADVFDYRVHFCRDYGEFQRMKALYPEGTHHWHYTLAPFNEQVDNQIEAHLAVWPPPDADVQGGLLARGRRMWVPILDDAKPQSGVIPLPVRQPLYETLFIELVRAYACGYEKDGTTDVENELERVLGGRLYSMCMDADLRAFGGTEPTRNTAVEVGRRLAGAPDAGREYNGPQVWADYP